MKRGILIGVAGTLATLVAGAGALILWVKDDLVPYDESYPNSH